MFHPPPLRARLPRRGLTLIELVVVLTILIALAGILIPMLPSMLTRGRTATVSTNVGEINKSIQTYYQLYNGYPDQCDALSDGTVLVDYLAGGVLDPIPAPPQGQVAGQISDGQLTAVELAAVQAAGITKVNLMVGTAAQGAAIPGWGPTFNPYLNAQTAPTPITTATHLAFIDPVNNPNALPAVQLLNLSPTGKYLVLGIGPRCTLVGKTVAEAPIIFGDNQALNPEFGYERYAALYLVSDVGNPAAVPPVQARIIRQVQLSGVISLQDIGIGGANDHLQSWYDLGQGSN